MRAVEAKVVTEEPKVIQAFDEQSALKTLENFFSFSSRLCFSFAQLVVNFGGLRASL